MLLHAVPGGVATHAHTHSSSGVGCGCGWMRNKSDPALTSMLRTGFLRLPGWECKHHETRRRPQPVAVGSHMAQLQKYFSLDQKGTIIAEYIW